MNRNKMYAAVCCATIALGSTAGALAQDSAVDSLSSMVTDGKVSLDLRYRYEYVDQDGIDRNAGASTLRSRLTFASAAHNGFSFLAEVDNVSRIGSERYNSTENGETSYPVVADPTGTDFNQALIKYSTDQASGIYGRQRILHANQRFIGGVAWRQNEQTYDGFRANWNPGPVKLDYSYVYNVKRIFGPDDGANPADLHGTNHFLRADYSVAEGHNLAAYGYLFDFDEQSKYPAGKTVNNSSDTWGVEYNGDFKVVKLHAAWATQSDAGDNTRSYDADYYTVDVGGALGPVGLKAGIEVLGAGDGVGFSTPLATLHKFQGWADKFLGTPGDGIEDVFVGASGKVGPVKLQAVYHDFSAEDSSGDFGSEIDLAATWAVTKGLTAQLKYADFSTDDKARFADTTKVWMTFQLKI